jgi:hypothetical protein
MALMPKSVNGQIQFFEAHLSDWTTNAVAIGSSAPEVAAIAAKTEAARAALVAQETAQDTAKTRTAELRQAVDALLQAGSDLIKKVRAKAATDGDVIYNLANIPAPATPSAVGQPGQPTALQASLLPNGTLDLSWKCTNPPGCNGVIYQIYRKIESTGDYHYLGGSGDKTWTDNTLPAGVPSVTYQIQGTRSTAIGVAAEFTVNFGVSNGSGVSVIASTAKAQPQPARIAA